MAKQASGHRPETRQATGQDAKLASQLELSIKLSVISPEPRQPKFFTLRENADVVLIGRDYHCDLQLHSAGVSREHVKLFVQPGNGRNLKLMMDDTSSNKTGLYRYKLDRNLSADQLENKDKLVIPAETPRDPTQFIVQVEFCLPDAYCRFSGTGRWDYFEKLGDGGLGTVYRAIDKTLQIRGDVAIKICKFTKTSLTSPDNRHIYNMHREAQWSLQRLHNQEHARYHSEGARLFVKYLEDHTGLGVFSSLGSFDLARQYLEDPKFDWRKEQVQANHHPYIVMELLRGKVVQQGIDDGSLHSIEKKILASQAVEAVCYMQRFDLIHRDYRTCNMFMEGRGAEVNLKVIDYGFMICTEAWQHKNTNLAVKIPWSKRTTTEPSRSLYDWAPPEVRVPKGAPNFGDPASSFDVFSLGVFLCKLLKGRPWTSGILSDTGPDERIKEADWASIGLNGELMMQMLHQDSRKRPRPCHLLQAATGYASLEELWIRKNPGQAASRNQERSRSPARRGPPRGGQ